MMSAVTVCKWQSKNVRRNSICKQQEKMYWTEKYHNKFTTTLSFFLSLFLSNSSSFLHVLHCNPFFPESDSFELHHLVSKPTIAYLASRLGEGTDSEKALGGPLPKSMKKNEVNREKMVRWIGLNYPVSQP